MLQTCQLYVRNNFPITCKSFLKSMTRSMVREKVKHMLIMCSGWKGVKRNPRSSQETGTCSRPGTILAKIERETKTNHHQIQNKVSSCPRQKETKFAQQWRWLAHMDLVYYQSHGGFYDWMNIFLQALTCQEFFSISKPC